MKRRRKQTSSNPFPNDELFKGACMMCETYAGDEHSYESWCENCPVYRMAERHDVLCKEFARVKYEQSWNGVQDMGR